MIPASGTTDATSGNLGRRSRFSGWEDDDFDDEE